MLEHRFGLPFCSGPFDSLSVALSESLKPLASREFPGLDNTSVAIGQNYFVRESELSAETLRYIY